MFVSMSTHKMQNMQSVIHRFFSSLYLNIHVEPPSYKTVLVGQLTLWCLNAGISALDYIIFSGDTSGLINLFNACQSNFANFIGVKILAKLQKLTCVQGKQVKWLNKSTCQFPENATGSICKYWVKVNQMVRNRVSAWWSTKSSSGCKLNRRRHIWKAVRGMKDEVIIFKKNLLN
jgi:hypothetical protein